MAYFAGKHAAGPLCFHAKLFATCPWGGFGLSLLGSRRPVTAATLTLACATGGCGLMMLSSMSMRVCTAAELSWGTADVASTRVVLAAGGLPSSGCAICRRALIPLATAVTAASSAPRRLCPQEETQYVVDFEAVPTRRPLKLLTNASPHAVTICVTTTAETADGHSRGAWPKECLQEGAGAPCG